MLSTILTIPGFSMARVMACILRIASVSLMKNVSLAIAANIFVAAGVVILFVINIIFTQRITRAAHPHFGWHKAFESAVKILIALVIIMIIMLITVVIQTFYTLNPRIRKIDRDIQLAGLTYFAFVSFLPIPVVILGLLIPRSRPINKFGTGRWRTKIRILLLSSTLVSFGACYRAGTQYLTPRPMTQPIYPVMHKAAFYLVNFTIEIIVLFLYAVLRVDLRFHIPDGSRNSYIAPDGWKDPEHKLEEGDSRDGTPTGGLMLSNSANASKTISVPPSEHSMKEPMNFKSNSKPSTPLQIYSEEETFDDKEPEWNVDEERQMRRGSHLGHVRIESGDFGSKPPEMVAQMAGQAKANAEAELASQKSMASLAKPKETGNQFAADLEKPKETLEQPITKVEKPKEVSEQHIPEVEQPKEVVSQPTTEVEQPTEVVDTPTNVIETPKTEVELPKAEVEKPAEVAEKPNEV
jgi:hypothetical protein